MRIKGLNSAYYGTEKRIMDATAKILKDNYSICIRTRDISREAGIALSSFYIHYHSLRELMDKNKERFITGLERVVELQINEDASIERKIRNILFYFYRYRAFLRVVCISRNTEVIDIAISKLKPLNREYMPRYDSYIKKCLYNMLAAEFIAEINLWWHEDFSIKHMPEHARHIAIFIRSTPKIYASIYSQNHNM